MRAIRGAVASSLALALAACAFAHGPEPLPPTRPLDENVLTLDRAVNLALANSPMLAQSRARVEQAQGLAIQAGLYPNPQENSGNPLQFGGANSSYSIGVQQEIVRAGKIPLNRAAAEQGVRQANLDFVRQQFDLITAVRQQFYMQLAAQKRIETLRKMQNLAQQSLDISIKLKQNEQVAETDILLLQIELQRLAVSLRSAEQVILAGTQQLAAMIGLPNLRIDRVAGELTAPLPDFNDPSVREQLLARSSLVESARAEITRNQILLRRAEVEPIPNLLLNTGYQNTASLPHSQYLLGLYFNIPIWDRNQGNIRAAGANVRQAAAQLNTVQFDLLRQLADALGRYRAAQITVETYEKGILPNAERTFGLVRRGLDAGQFDLLRILQAQRSVFEANLDYVAALQDRLAAAVTIAGLLQLQQFP